MTTLTGSYARLPEESRRIIDNTIQLEGRYSNNPYDSGGKTMYGITEAVARENGYTGPMQDLSLSLAKDIYASQYWLKNWCDRMVGVSGLLAEFHFDMSVNGGNGRPWQIESRILNALNNGNWDTLPVSTSRSETVLVSLQKAIEAFGEKEVVNYMTWGQAAFYTELTERRPKDRAFYNGWILNRIRFV